MTLQEVASRFPGGKWTRPDNYETCCRSHQDRKASLGIARGENGGIVVYCQAGCSTSDVLQAAGLTMADLQPPASNNNGSHRTEIVASYRYDDEQGNLVATKHRKSDKSFLWQNAEGAWTTRGLALPLFGLPDLMRSRPGQIVCIAEGEKDVLSLRKMGMIATCNPHGASRNDTPKWTQADTEWLRAHLPDRQFLIFADNDEAGHKHAEVIYHSLQRAGLSVRYAQMEGLGKGEDISDWLQRHTVADFQELLKAKPVAPKGSKVRGYTAAELLQMSIPRQEWAVPQIFPSGFTILAGGQKLGKSRLLYDACIAVASGGQAFGKIPVEQGEVLYLALEDSDRRLKDRLIEILGEKEAPAALHIFPEWPSIAEGGLDELRRWLGKHPKTRMVALDTIGVMRSGMSSGKSNGVYQDDYELGRALLSIPREFDIAMVGAHHTNKKEDWQDWTNSVSGSVGLTGAADATILFQRERGADEARLRGTGRDVFDFDLVLNWDENASIWVISGTYEDEKRSPERYEILELIAAKGPLSPRDTADLLGKNHNTTKNLMLKMFQRGELKRDRKGVYSIPSAAPDEMEWGS